MKLALTALTLVAVLSACSSAPRKPDYECPLDDVSAAKCSSVQEAYAKSKSMKAAPGTSRVQSVFDPRVQGASAAAAAPQPVFSGQASNYPDAGTNGMPVFQQPQVMRAWVAPYVDANGNLRSGEYTYFSTPGKWNYGDLKRPGAASGIFEPGRADRLGFNPVMAPPASAPAAGAPARPAEPARPAGGLAGAPNSVVNSPALAGAPASSTAVITQPYQRLSN
jgi:conjugal transfer pilus assembly protein TraV